MKRTSSILAVLISLIAVVFIGTLIASAIGIAPIIPIAVLLAGSLIPLNNRGIALSSLSVTELNTKLGAYFRKEKGELTTKLLVGMNIDDRFEMMDDCKDEIPLPSLTITDLVKPADSANFTPTANALGFGARIGKVRPWKVDLQIIPSILEKTWLGQYKKKGSKSYDLPFEQFVINHIIEKVHENLRLQSLYKGVYNAAGTTPIDVMNGLLKLVTDEIALGTSIVPITTGAITSANVIDKLELVYDGLGHAYKSVPTQMIVNTQIFTWYKRKFRSTYGANNDYDGQTKKMEVELDGTMCTILAEPGLGASQRIITTPKENKVYMTDTLGEENDITSQVFDRTIKLLIDGKSGVDFKRVDADLLAVNEQV